jgi:fructose 1,6-bisphosphatase
VTLEEARRRLRQLKASWEYAFAMGHGCSIGSDPRFETVRREAADLAAIIAEHGPAEPGP